MRPSLRRLSSAPVGGVSSVLSEMPGLPALKPARSLPPPVTQLTTLPNGLRVATEETYGQVAAVALFVDAGSMYETPASRGCAHLLENLAFKSTSTRSTADVDAIVTQHGLSPSAASTREFIMYKVDTLRGSTEAAVELLADTVTRPTFAADEMALAKMVANFQHQDLSSNPSLLIQEVSQAAAFGPTSALGQQTMCSEDILAATTDDGLRQFMGAYFTAPRMVLSGAGVAHDELVRFAEEYMSDLPAVSATTPVVPEVNYTGGDIRLGPLPGVDDGQTHISVAFKSSGWTSDDLVPLCVLDTLLGGGSSFSVGGPGKGMYSRLYREVLNMHSWVQAINAYTVQTANVGLFGIYGACNAEHATALMNVMYHNLMRLHSEPVSEEELSRARNQLRSSLLMNLETRAILCEDIGRQILSSNKRLEPAHLCEAIAAVTAEDLSDVARRALSTPPAFACIGDHSRVPAYQAFAGIFNQ